MDMVATKKNILKRDQDKYVQLSFQWSHHVLEEPFDSSFLCFLIARRDLTEKERRRAEKITEEMRGEGSGREERGEDEGSGGDKKGGQWRREKYNPCFPVPKCQSGKFLAPTFHLSTGIPPLRMPLLLVWPSSALPPEIMLLAQNVLVVL